MLFNRSRRSFVSIISTAAIVAGVAVSAAPALQELEQQQVEATQEQEGNVDDLIDHELVFRQPEPPRTAEELLEAIESEQTVYFAPDGELPPEEAGRAVEILREMYPMESIRERMSFQEGQPEPAVTTSDPAFLSFSQPSRVLALRELHSNEVNDFINRPGQGLRRIRIISPYDLPIQYGIAQIDHVPVDSQLLSEPLVDLAKTVVTPEGNIDRARSLSLNENGLPTTYVAESFHHDAVDRFASAATTGLVLGLDEVAGFEAHRVRMDESVLGDIRRMSSESLLEIYPEIQGADVRWKLNRLELVGLLLHDEPGVYVTDELPDMEELAGLDVERRNLNAFEMDALEKLRAGDEVVHSATPNRIVMLGAITATDSCLQCHAVEKGELLGAFSYEFLRDPVVDLNAIQF